jgi:2-oxoglutarate dehydrogenase E2 component (dihydrolipoamide succinyltransferase)
LADVTLPSLGESVTEGIITQWFKKVGDAVARDEALFEVSTDKVDSEMPSPAAGVLTQILAQEGDTVQTGSRVAVIDENAVAGSTPLSAPTRARRTKPRSWAW